MSERDSHASGLAFGLGAYAFWGFAPLFWRLLSEVPATELLAHRLSWACVFFCVWLAVRGRLGEVKAVLGTPGVRWRLVGAALLVASNWFVFVYAVLVDRVLDVSLGYFINTLVSVALGRLVLGERLRRLQLVAVIVAGGGIAIVAVAAGGIPWISLVLALSFGGYGLVRKTTQVKPLPGSAFETLLLLPFGLAFIAYLTTQGQAHFLTGHGLATDLLIVGTGPVTAIPLLLFVNAARRLRLTTIGFLQYLAPSLQFVVAVVFFHEPTPAPRLAAFALVWVALALFSASTLDDRKRGRGR